MAKTIDPVRPSVGLALAYRRRLDALIDEMHNSVTYWARAKYKATPPELAADESPARTMERLMRKLARRWQRRFDDLSDDLAKYFATAVEDRSKRQLQAALRKAGWAVQFKPTRAQNDAYQAVVAENVQLIKSIPQQYLGQVQGQIMRNVSQGRDLSDMVADLQTRYGVTKRRAALICRDQNNKATAVFTRVRQQELGITEAIWMHSHGGKEPRPSHLANDGKPYNVATGWYDPDEEAWIWPGELINCRCVSRSIIPGLA